MRAFLQKKATIVLIMGVAYWLIAFIIKLPEAYEELAETGNFSFPLDFIALTAPTVLLGFLTIFYAMETDYTTKERAILVLAAIVLIVAWLLGGFFLCS